nr:MAG TPA: hypothetical protein [Caudoviricetes sp.]
MNDSKIFGKTERLNTTCKVEIFCPKQRLILLFRPVTYICGAKGETCRAR